MAKQRFSGTKHPRGVTFSESGFSVKHMKLSSWRRGEHLQVCYQHLTHLQGALSSPASAAVLKLYNNSLPSALLLACIFRQASLKCPDICFPGLTMSEMHSNSLVFLFAGYDTVSMVLSLVLFALAANQDCLRTAQEEVDEKIGKVGSSFSLITLPRMSP